MPTRVIITLAGTLLAAHASAQTLTRLPTLGGSSGFAHDINDAGQIVGESQIAGDTYTHATIWNNHLPTDLGTLGAGENSVAWAINNQGVAVGTNDLASGLRTATRFDQTGITDIGLAMGATGPSVAWDINDHGVIVGQAPLSPGFAKGFYYSDTDGGLSAGTPRFYNGGANLSVNNAGESVGHAFFFGDPSVATHASPDGSGGYDVAEIGPSGLNFSMATAITDSGIIVGHASGVDGDTSGNWQAVIYEPDGRGGTNFIPLGRLDGLSVSEALDVNESGTVVGFGFDGDGLGLAPRAFAWVDGTMHELNDLLDDNSDFVTLFQATGINEQGDIVGFGETRDGTIAPFVLTGFVPAPSTSALITFAGLALTRRRRSHTHTKHT